MYLDYTAWYRLLDIFISVTVELQTKLVKIRLQFSTWVFNNIAHNVLLSVCGGLKTA